MNKPLSVVTGASGHIGYALINELDKNKDPFRILIRSESAIFDAFGCEKAFGDVTDYDSLVRAFEGAEIVYHLAGIIDVSDSNADAVWRVNVEGTKNVVKACKACSVRRLVYASSVNAMPDLDGNEVITEMERYNPDIITGVYGKTKATATDYVLKSADNEFEVIVVLPGACIGPYDYKVSSAGEMVRMIMRGRLPVSLSFGRYNFVDVRDVAAGMVAAAYKGRPGESYLLTGQIMESHRIIAIIAEKCGRKPPKVKMPYWLARILAPLAEVYYKVSGDTPLFTRLSIKILTYNCNFSYQKAAEELGFNPMSTEQSISDMVNWIAKHENIACKSRR